MNEEQQQDLKRETHRVRDAVKGLASESAEVAREAGESTKSTIKKPTTGAAVVGAVAATAAFTFGVVETAVGGAAAYVTYRLLRKRRLAGAS